MKVGELTLFKRGSQMDLKKTVFAFLSIACQLRRDPPFPGRKQNARAIGAARTLELKGVFPDIPRGFQRIARGVNWVAPFYPFRSF